MGTRFITRGSGLQFRRPGRIGFWLLLGWIFLAAMGAPKAQAASVEYKGIALTPAVISVDVTKGQPQTYFDVQVANHTRTRQNLILSSIDFKSLNQGGGLAFIGSSSQHGLASWLNLGNGTVELDPGQTRTVHLSVEDRSDLAPGGHYAAVLFKSAQGSSSSGTNQVAVNQVVSALVFVRKLDGAKFGIASTNTSVPRPNWLSFPGTVNVVFQNTGNIQETPRGVITVSGPFAREAARGIINTDSNLLLPDSSRLFQVSMSPSHRSWWPGMYHVHATYRYDGSSSLQSTEVSFFYLNPLFVALVLAVVFALYYLYRKRQLIYWKLIKLYKKSKKSY